MNKTEVGAVFAKVQLGDNRKDADEPMLREWHDVIGDLDLDEAIAAVVEFRKTSPGAYLMPGYLLGIAKKRREARAEERHHRALAATNTTVRIPIPLNIDAMMRAYRRHDRAYDAYIEDPENRDRSADLYAALADVEHEEAAYNRQLVEAGIAPVSNPIDLRGMKTRGVLA